MSKILKCRMLTKEEPAYNTINLDEILAPTNVRKGGLKRISYLLQ